jgi:hypothetical protein
LFGTLFQVRHGRSVQPNRKNAKRTAKKSFFDVTFVAMEG